MPEICLPDEWETCKVEEIADPTPRSIAIGPFGSALTADMYSPNGIPLLRGQDITSDKRLNDDNLVFVPEEIAARFPSSIVSDGDLVFPHRGAIGRVGIVGSRKFLLSSSMMKLSCDRRKVDPRFVFYYFRGPGREELLARASTVGTPGIGQPLQSLRGIRITRPPMVEQVRIADVLEALDDKIAVNDRLVLKVKELLVAEFASLRQDDESVLVPISELVEFNPKLPKPHVEEPVYLEMKNLPDRAITVTSWSRRAPRGGARFQNGDTLLARITPCLENGKTGYVDFLADDEVGIGSTEFIVMRARNGIPAALPYFVAIDATFREFAIKRMVGTSGRQRLSAGDVANFLVRRPSERGLARFSSLSDALLGRVKAAVDESRALTSTRDELLPLLMSGKIRVREAEKIVEGVV
ncbi:restriction endonuclease subunit S [Amycolatopsis methanolica]|uniref:restriction endonuclease subunit S n=1 Tax=Amycolatopsis methanolica TaxID=1814 RepID=UPI00342FD62C